MTNQRDPERRRPQDYIRRDDGSYSALPIMIGLALLVVLGIFLMNNLGTDRGPSAQRTDAPVTNSTPRTTPTTPSAPK